MPGPRLKHRARAPPDLAQPRGRVLDAIIALWRRRAVLPVPSSLQLVPSQKGRDLIRFLRKPYTENEELGVPLT
jgi:hypothetical protein